MKKKALACQWFCWYLGRMLFVLLMAGIAVPAMAILSGTTEQIQGQAPMVSGYLQVLLPDGKTELADNAMLGLNQIPSQFGVSSSTVSLELQDADGDTALGAVIDTQSATLAWKLDGTELTSAQLSAPFGDNFQGRTLTLDVSAPVTASSVSGKPTTAEPQIISGFYTLVVPSPGIAFDDFTAASGAVANGQSGNLLTAIVRDESGSVLSGVDVTFTVTNGAATPATQKVKTDGSGLAQASLVSTVAGDNQVTASVSNTTTVPKTSSFIAVPADSGKSSLVVLPVSIVANGTATSTLTFTARDASNNLLTDRTVTFTTSGTGATGVKVGTVTESNGVYTATLTAGTTAGAVTVAVAVDGSTVAGKTGSITLTTPVNLTGIVVNGYNFAIDAGFPSTGFIGATFTLNMSGIASDYSWKSSSSWATVDSSGIVSFIAKGNNTPVTITATPKVGGAPLIYTFSVSLWFINDNSDVRVSYDEASRWCSTQMHEIPLTAELTLGRSRGVGALWSEWGNLKMYSSSGFSAAYYIVSPSPELADTMMNWVNLTDGDSGSSAITSGTGAIVCR